jgi:tetratricopeptide (TPR) repeat protein
MTARARLYAILIFAFTFISTAPSAEAQNSPGSLVLHRVEGRVRAQGPVNDVYVRILQRGGMIPVEEGYTRDEGQFTFTRVPEGEYVIETVATDKYEASLTNVSLFPLDRKRPEVFRVYVQLQPKPPPGTDKPAVLTADVDVRVPKEAQKRYREALKSLSSGNSTRAVEELQAALKIYPDYYAARLELGRILRIRKQFKEAAEVFKPLAQLAPKRAEPRIEYGIVLLALDKREDAVRELRAALELEETNWIPHLYLGMSLMQTDAADAEKHLRRSLELSETKAARAHLSLAELAAAKGQRPAAIEHLQAYLKLAPDAPDAQAVRGLIERLRANK